MFERSVEWRDWLNDWLQTADLDFSCGEKECTTETEKSRGDCSVRKMNSVTSHVLSLMISHLMERKNKLPAPSYSSMARHRAADLPNRDNSIGIRVQVRGVLAISQPLSNHAVYQGCCGHLLAAHASSPLCSKQSMTLIGNKFLPSILKPILSISYSSIHSLWFQTF